MQVWPGTKTIVHMHHLVLHTKPHILCKYIDASRHSPCRCTRVIERVRDNEKKLRSRSTSLRFVASFLRALTPPCLVFLVLVEPAQTQPTDLTSSLRS